MRFCVLYLWGDRGGTYTRICLLGLDDGLPYEKTALSIADTLGPHFDMLDHEPAHLIVVLQRDVPLPLQNRETLIAWNQQHVRRHASFWAEFPEKLRDALRELG